MMGEVSLTDCSVNPVDLACMQIGLKWLFQWNPYAVTRTVKTQWELRDETRYLTNIQCHFTVQKHLTEIFQYQCHHFVPKQTGEENEGKGLSLGERRNMRRCCSRVLMCSFLLLDAASMPGKRIWSKWGASPETLLRRGELLHYSSNEAFKVPFCRFQNVHLLFVLNRLPLRRWWVGFQCCYFNLEIETLIT